MACGHAARTEGKRNLSVQVAPLFSVKRLVTRGTVVGGGGAASDSRRELFTPWERFFGHLVVGEPGAAAFRRGVGARAAVIGHSSSSVRFLLLSVTERQNWT